MKQVRNVWTPIRHTQQVDTLDTVAGLLILGIPAIFFFAVFACM